MFLKYLFQKSINLIAVSELNRLHYVKKKNPNIINRSTAPDQNQIKSGHISNDSV